MKNNDDIGVGENIFTQKNYSEFSENRDDDSFNIDKFNNIIPNSFCDNSNYNFLYNINFIGYMPFENKLKSNEAKESQETLNIKKISEMEKEKQLVMKEQELIEKEKELIEKETALNMEEKEKREKIQQEFREKEILKKEEKKI